MANQNELITYFADSSSEPVGFVFDGETLWATQEQIATAFQTSVQNVSQHIKNIYADDELAQADTLKKIFKPVDNGQSHQIQHYSLDVVISVGYRVSSRSATAFRQWATRVVRERVLKDADIPGVLSTDEQRVMISDRVAVENSELIQSARALGIEDDRAFLEAGYQGLYKNHMADIKKLKGLKEERLLDRAGITELAANEFRITQANDKLKRLKDEDGILVGHTVALTVHHDVGRTIRGAIEEIDGVMPEDLPLEPEHIADVRKRVLIAKVKPKEVRDEQKTI